HLADGVGPGEVGAGLDVRLDGLAEADGDAAFALVHGLEAAEEEDGDEQDHGGLDDAEAEAEGLREGRGRCGDVRAQVGAGVRGGGGAGVEADAGGAAALDGARLGGGLRGGGLFGAGAWGVAHRGMPSVAGVGAAEGISPARSSESTSGLKTPRPKSELERT